MRLPESVLREDVARLRAKVGRTERLARKLRRRYHRALSVVDRRAWRRAGLLLAAERAEACLTELREAQFGAEMRLVLYLVNP